MIILWSKPEGWHNRMTSQIKCKPNHWSFMKLTKKIKICADTVPTLYTLCTMCLYDVRTYVSTPNFKFHLQNLNFAHFISLLPAKVDSMRGGHSQGDSIWIGNSFLRRETNLTKYPEVRRGGNQLKCPNFRQISSSSQWCQEKVVYSYRASLRTPSPHRVNLSRQ